MTETTAEQNTAAAAPQPAPAAIPTARFPLPAGVVTPIQLRNELVKQGKAPATLKPQQTYAWVKSPGKNDPFPVKWYDAEGNVYDKQPAGDNAPLTRPGIPTLQEGIDWYERKASAPKTAPATTTPGTVQTTDAVEDESVDEEFDGVEDENK